MKMFIAAYYTLSQQQASNLQPFLYERNALPIELCWHLPVPVSG